MKKIKICFTLWLSGLTIILSAQKPKSHIAFINGIIHVGNGTVYETGIMAMQGNSLEMVMDMKGLRLNPSAYDTVIDLQGKHVYPALINTNNVLGLHDAEAVRATLDFQEVGGLNPHVRSLIAYNTDNKITPTVKTNGVLYTQVTPRGNLIAGSSSIVALEGWNWEDAVLKADDGVHLFFPVERYMGWGEDGFSLKKNKAYQEQLINLNRFFEDAKFYCSQTSVTEKNIRFEAMRGVFNGTQRLYIMADKAHEMTAAIQFGRKHGIKNIVLCVAGEADKIAGLLKRESIPVILGRLHDLPEYEHDDVDAVFKVPARLKKDSIVFCLSAIGDMEAMQSRNLPFLAGTASAYGLSKEEALQSVTLDAARILGVDKQLGSLEAGKLASFVISKGDLLDMRTNAVEVAYISGTPVKLSNQQTELYEKYKAKYGIK
ncbi:MAG: amidohydrolase family protein [Sediminibacterium sp.]|nr:amidohydrolase family protein [Sediminibacterium sp.]